VLETEIVERRWAAFVCPECRLVFRVPDAHEGRGIVCNCCQRILRIPTTLDQLQSYIPQGTTDGKIDHRRTNSDYGINQNINNKRSQSATRHDWELQPLLSSQGEQQRLRWLMLGGGGLFLITIISILWLLKNNPITNKNLVVSNKLPVKQELAKTATVSVPSELLLENDQKDLIRRFVEAKSIEQILPLIRHPEITESKLHKFYPTGNILPVGMNRVDFENEGYQPSGIIRAEVTTRDLDVKTIYLSDGPSGTKIDWESWVDYSEMNWADFIASKPEQAQRFRVIITPIEYYNFNFKDETKWQSYRISSADGNHLIYGYVEKNSPLFNTLKTNENCERMLLMLKFPPGENINNQILIDQIVTTSWAESEAKP
jgi:hypothetical protein